MRKKKLGVWRVWCSKVASIIFSFLFNKCKTSYDLKKKPHSWLHPGSSYTSSLGVKWECGVYFAEQARRHSRLFFSAAFHSLTLSSRVSKKKPSQLLPHSFDIHHVIYILLTVGWTPGIHTNARFLEISADDLFEAVFCFSTRHLLSCIDWHWLPSPFFCNSNLLNSTSTGNLGWLLLGQPGTMLYGMNPSRLLSFLGTLMSNNSCFAYVTRNSSLLNNSQNAFLATNENLSN